METHDQPRSSDRLSPPLTDLLRELDDESLRAAIDYGQELLNHRHEPTARIEARPDEEVLSVEEHDLYTTVVKQHDCEGGCAECPHGPYLYRVRREDRMTGEQASHWTYLGRVHDA